MTKRITVVLHGVGFVVSFSYLVAALFLGPRFGITAVDKANALARIENAATGKDAIAFADPILSQMLSVITAAKVALFLSCGLAMIMATLAIIAITFFRRNQVK